jgi:hypothetical protein
MLGPIHPRDLRLHFEGPLTRDHTLPAPALVQALQQLQRVVHLLAIPQNCWKSVECLHLKVFSIKHADR